MPSRTASSIVGPRSARPSSSTSSSTSRLWISPGLATTVASPLMLNSVSCTGTHFRNERDCVCGCGAQRELALRLALQADERLERANDLGDLHPSAVRQRDPVIELCARFGVGERKLCGADEPDERVRDLVQGASRQQPESLERTRLGGVGGHALYDPHADLRPVQTTVMQTPLTRYPKTRILEPRV